MEMSFIFKFLELMKKLRLNKEVIASLDNPNRIVGGENGGGPITQGGATCGYTCNGPTCEGTCGTCNGATCAGGATCDGQYTCPRPNAACIDTSIPCAIKTGPDIY